jgi:hypothetical protein
MLAAVILALALPALGAGDDLKPVDIKHMLPGYCHAGSRPDPKAIGGYGNSDNNPRRLTDKSIGTDGKVSLLALPDQAVPFGQSSRGFRLLLINRTKAEVAFPASDARLSIIQEALDSKGTWRPIEYLPRSFCGNSYHRVFLPRNAYWQFAPPSYSGPQKTKLRFVLQGQQPIYSNEFEGSINPEQFTKKQGHEPISRALPRGLLGAF